MFCAAKEEIAKVVGDDDLKKKYADFEKEMATTSCNFYTSAEASYNAKMKEKEEK